LIDNVDDGMVSRDDTTNTGGGGQQERNSPSSTITSSGDSPTTGPTYSSPKARQDAAIKAATRAALRGALYGFTASTSLTLLLHYTWPLYRSITLPGKVMWISVATLATAIITSEHAIYYFNRPQLFVQTTVQGRASKSLTLREWTLKHSREIILATLGTTLIGGILVGNRNKYLSGTSIFMNARLGAQGLGLGMACLAVAAGTAKGKKKTKED
jgi:hypothetical protein